MKKMPPIKLSGKQSHPVKILLHMVKVGDEWAGKVTCFTNGEEYLFNNLEELFAWLRRQGETLETTRRRISAEESRWG